MRIGIVNDLKMTIEVLRRILSNVPEYEIAWIALNGEEAVQNCIKDKPDLVLMDLLMPVKGGVEATREIMAVAPCPILIVTASVDSRASLIFEAMGYGALDAVCTPSLDSLTENQETVNELLKKIHLIFRLSGKASKKE